MKGNFFIMAGLILFFASCRKDTVVHPLAGTYECTVFHHYWDMSGANTNSTSHQFIEANLVEDSIVVFGVQIHKDEIEYGESFFFGNGSNYMNFRFERDSIYMYRYSGGLGGGGSSSYRGKKMN